MRRELSQMWEEQRVEVSEWMGLWGWVVIEGFVCGRDVEILV